ncbi:SDR family oxidoreductase [Mycobacterium sp. 29Ha]|uniref:SDR family oxidoreductase n=1 Tax=Mycobacterium sp. 29Ha TaxID=2939268 RepID=UPI002939399A|nr:SDR family oxidoreductase [Mycobacterium sp. 29Ha]MDV3133255.1 SDR family oxidoreductase [Mycobacterium sp. 29Ha]
MAELGYDGKVAIVTGAGNGLGKEHAMLLASRGARVVVNDLGGNVAGVGADSTAAEAVVKEIEAAGGVALADGHSVATQEGGIAIVQTALDAFGRVDILVNNAGILRDKSFQNLTPELLDTVINVHLYGTIWVTQPAFVKMREQGYGRIVNTSSAAGIFGNFGQANYGAAKMGIVGFTRVLAQEGAKYNVTANAIAPMARTRMTEELLGPVADKLDPALVAPVVAYLCHESCDLTSRIFSVGGGRVAEIFIGVTKGFSSPALDVEAVQDNLEAICDRRGYITPAQANDEIGLVLQALG